MLRDEIPERQYPYFPNKMLKKVVFFVLLYEVKLVMQLIKRRAAVLVFCGLLIGCEQHPLPGEPKLPEDSETQSLGADSDAEKKANWDAMTAWGTVGACVAAALSAWLAYLTIRKADQTQRELREDARKERLANLWADAQELKYLTSEQLNDLADPDVGKIVRKNANILGKAGFLWETRLVDREMAERQLGEGCLRLFEQIDKLGNLPSLARTGSELLDENPSARLLFVALQKRYPPPVA